MEEVEEVEEADWMAEEGGSLAEEARAEGRGGGTSGETEGRPEVEGS